MPIYEVQAPDGRIVSLEGPEGASQEEVMAQAQTLYQPEPIAAPAGSADPLTGFSSGAAGMGEGFFQTVAGLTAAGANAIQPAVSALIPDRFENSVNIPDALSPVASSQKLSDKLGEVREDINFQPTVSAADVFSSPSGFIQNAPTAMAEQIPAALPYLFSSMLGPAGWGANFGAVTGNVAKERAEAKGEETPTPRTVLESAPFGVASAVLDKVGAGKILKPLQKTGVGRVTASGGTEGGTEFAQSLIEQSGSILGTEKEFDPKTGFQEAGLEALVGTGLGGGITAGVETAKAGVATARAAGDAVGLGGTSVDPFDLGAGTRKELPQAQQRPSQDTATPPAEQATSEPVESPPVPEATANGQNAVPTQPAAPDPAIDPPAPVRPEETVKRKKAVTPDGSIEIETEDEVVDLSTLITSDQEGFDPALQPRDRKKATSDLQIQRIAQELDPARLGDSRTTDQGAPIVGPDNLVESGNGRTAGIRAATPEGRAAYRASLEAEGFNVEGIENPVRIRRRVTEMTPEERVRFTNLSNKSQIAELSSTEKATADAAQIDDGVLELHQGGDPDSQDNQDFVRAFIGKVTTGNEAGALIGSDKRLTQEGVKRVKAALVAKAYNNAALVENIFDSADPEVKSIGNVLRDQAPEYAKLEASDVPDRFKIAPQLMKAVEKIRDAKRNNTPISEVISGDQGTLIEEGAPDPLIDKLVEFMYRPEFGRMLSQPDLTRILGEYARKAREQSDEDLFGENTTQPVDLLQSAYDEVVSRLQARSDGQGNLLAAEQSAIPVEDTGGSDSRAFADSDPDTTERPESDKSSSSVEEDADNDGKKFKDFARPTSPNILKNVFTDAGFSAEESVNLSPNRQIEIIKKAMAEKFNIKVFVDRALDIKAARDQLADMYVGLQFMANVLGMPASFMGLNETLSVNLEAGKKKYLGVYRPGEKSIGLPGRTNSFAHEWLHAFDHHVMNLLRGDSTDLFSGLIRREGVIDPADSVQSAFANLMNAVFFDKSFMASKILELQHDALHSKSAKVRSEAERKLKQIEEGNYKGISGKTDLYTGSKKLGKGDSYWTSPEEMLARSFEAYVAYKVNEAGGMTQGLSKDNEAYMAEADERLALTFPKALERLAIFEAFDEFFARANERELLGKDARPDALPDLDLAMLDPRVLDKTAKGKFDDMPIYKRLIAQEKEAWKDWRAERKAIKERKKERAELGIEELQTVRSGLRQIQDDAVRAIRAVLHSYEKRHASISELKVANNRLVSRPGKASPRSVYSSDVEKIASRHHNRIHNIAKTHSVKDMAKKEIEKIRAIMQSREPGKGKAGKVAAGLRSILDSLYDEMKAAGIDVGYLKDAGYLSRFYMRDVILAKPAEFLEAAEKVYALQFDQIIEANPEAMREIIEGFLVQQPDGFSIDKKKLQNILDELDKGKDGDAAPLIQEVLSDVREAHAANAAASWLHRIRVGREDSIESTSPYAGFTKGRALPAEADTILEEFMETDPFTIVSAYTDKVAQKVAVHNVKTPKGQPSLESLYKAMLAKNVSKSDVDAIRNYHDTIMGLNEESASSKRAHPMLSRMYTFGTLMLLGKAVLSSLPEPMTFAMQTGDVRNALRSLTITISQIIKTNDMKQIAEMARAIGLVTEDMVATTIDARLGGGLKVGVGDRQVLSGFFRKTMLVPLTNSQRAKVLMLSLRHFNDLANQMDKINDPTGTQAGQITRKMEQWGVPKGQVKTFLKWLKKQDGIPSLEKLDTPMGRLFVDAAWNMNKAVIQDPKKEDRPYYANTPAGSIIYSVTSFGFAYWENVSKAMATRISETYKNDGGFEAAKLAGHVTSAYASLFAATLIYQTLRVALTDPEKWKELEEDDELLDYLVLRAFDYTAIHGPVASFGVNAWKGVRYMRDLATSFSGAHLSSYFDFLQKQARLLVQNTEDTNTAEYNAAKSFFKTIVGTSAAWALSKMPGGPIADVAQGTAIAAVTSSGAADQAAKLLVGEKGEKKDTGRARKERKPRERKERKPRDR